MASIFLSYSRDDRPRAQIIAEALEAEGLTVWWDKVLRAGQTYDEVTESMLREADVVVVLWSETSVKSKWVRAEATLGQRYCELVPAMIEDAERPIMFELIQTADLIGWVGDRTDERWSRFVGDIKRSMQKVAADPVAAAPAKPTPAPIAPEAPQQPVTPPPPPPPPQPAAVEVQTAPAPAPKKKSSPLPLLLGGLIVLGAGGWFGMQTFLGPDGTEPSNAADQTEASGAAESCDVCPEMIRVPAGDFTMGSTADEANRSGNEGPMREVAVQSFWMSKTEITWDAWQICVDAGACRDAQGSGAGTMPVTGVSWRDATAYTVWLSQVSGRDYRLPSEAEWEYAARANTATAYWWGNSFPGPGAVRGQASDVGDLPENAFGLTGMLGNVREWVADCYVNNYSDAPTDGSAVTSGDCSRPVVRGGSFKDGVSEHRAANRARFGRDVRDSGLGFRVAASPDRP